MYDKVSPKGSQSGRNLKLVLAYDGTGYHGFQVQSLGPTIQGVIEEVLSRVVGHATRVHGASRTDAGVHALSQVAGFRSMSGIPCDSLKRALNCWLPHDVRVLGAADVPPDFHPRFSARSKQYRYRIYTGEVVPPAVYRYVFHAPWLAGRDVESMARAAAFLAGDTDLAAFMSTGNPVGDTRRRVFAAGIEASADEIHFVVEAAGFLRHSVRAMVGTLFLVARGKIGCAEFEDLVRRGKRSDAGDTVPAKGLCLEAVRYE